MKIGLVCPYNIFKGGGVQECVLALQNEYVKLGHEATIITPRPRDYVGEAPDTILLVGLSTDVKTPFHTTGQVSVSVDNKALDELLATHNFDVLHFHEPWVPMVSRQILSRSTHANVATFHAKLPETVMAKTIERVITPYTKSILKYITSFTAVSDAAADYIGWLSKTQVQIVPNGINLSKYTAVKKTPSKQTILYVGRLERRKGVKYLLDAFKVLQEKLPDAELVIAGDGVDGEKLRQYVHDQKIANVVFKGFVSEQEKLDLFDSARVFCSPALFGESFGIVLLEAMAKHVPVVAGDNPGYSSVMKDKGQLSLVNPKDCQEFARRLELLLTDEEVRDLWTTWAKHYVEQFNYEQVARQYLDVYKVAIKKHRAESTSDA